MDALNPPGQRNAPFRESETEEISGQRLDSGLKIESMLLEEYSYAATTAYQAMEDRARMFNMYLLVVGILGSAFGAIYPLGGATRSFIQPVAAVVLFAAGVAGLAFFVLLIRLRQAFRQSLITMTVIKEFYIREFQDQMPNIVHAFRWRLKGIPAGERMGSVTFIVCHMVGFIGALCFAGCFFMINELLASVIPATQMWSLSLWQSVMAAAAVFVLVMACMVLYYRKALSRKDEQKILDAAEREVGKM